MMPYAFCCCVYLFCNNNYLSVRCYLKLSMYKNKFENSFDVLPNEDYPLLILYGAQC